MKKKNKELGRLEPNHFGSAYSADGYRSTGSQEGNFGHDSLRKRISDERALRRLSFVLYANDDAIDDLLHFMDDWERKTGRALFPLEASAPDLDLNDTLSQKAKRMLREREYQYQVMPEALRNESYVRILMALFIDSIQKVRTSSKSACLASGCPTTTALRYLDNLAAAGLLLRINSESDKRVTEIELTKQGLELARKLLD